MSQRNNLFSRKIHPEENKVDFSSKRESLRTQKRFQSFLTPDSLLENHKSETSSWSFFDPSKNSEFVYHLPRNFEESSHLDQFSCNIMPENKMANTRICYNSSNVLLMNLAEDIRNRLTHFGKLDDERNYIRPFKHSNGNYYEQDTEFICDDSQTDNFKLVENFNDFFVFEGNLEEFKGSDIFEERVFGNKFMKSKKKIFKRRKSGKNKPNINENKGKELNGDIETEKFQDKIPNEIIRKNKEDNTELQVISSITENNTCVQNERNIISDCLKTFNKLSGSFKKESEESIFEVNDSLFLQQLKFGDKINDKNVEIPIEKNDEDVIFNDDVKKDRKDCTERQLKDDWKKESTKKEGRIQLPLDYFMFNSNKCLKNGFKRQETEQVIINAVSSSSKARFLDKKPKIIRSGKLHLKNQKETNLDKFYEACIAKNNDLQSNK